MKWSGLGKKYVIGIDEAGRGPLAGPLALGFVKMSFEDYKRYMRLKACLKKGYDSKKLTAEERKIYLRQIMDLQKEGRAFFKAVLIPHTDIDKDGLTKVIKEGIAKGLKFLSAEAEDTLVLLDGGLRAPKSFKQFTIIKGDEKERVIGLASIVAKVKRDTYMIRASKKFPDYGFERHKGYGTRNHREAIRKNGLSPLHRVSFCGKFLSI